MDSLTTHLVARELDTHWRGRRLLGVSFDARTRVIRCAVEGDQGVEFDLSQPDVRIQAATSVLPGALLPGWRVLGVSAPVDERMIAITCEKVGRFRGSRIRRAELIISVVPAARGALLHDSSGHRMAVLGARLPALAEPRPQPEPDAVARLARAGNEQELLRARWMSPALADWLRSEPEQAADRYAAICALRLPDPELHARGLQPPWLPPAGSLILPRRESGPEAPPADVRWRDRALQRMREQLDRAKLAPQLRQVADALTALGDAEPPTSVTLPSGEEAVVEARLGETAIAVAERLYREARSMERAMETLPRRIEEVESTPAGATPARRVARDKRGDAQPAARPYRVYRSSGGLEIWVGRGAASNDLVTFRESSPADVWMHARASAGAHVVLRWQKDENPPARDLEEAAMLAAWHSKARGSTVVPVDWTRRRYVRKPRGAAPGKVVMMQAQTLFVRPGQEIERRLRTDR